jgi:hypothetical protein
MKVSRSLFAARPTQNLGSPIVCFDTRIQTGIFVYNNTVTEQMAAIWAKAQLNPSLCRAQCPVTVKKTELS